MSRFIQLHVLTSYHPSNLNRDDSGRPKSAQMGGVNRLRISSQSQKRTWRKSELFSDALKGNIGIRTKEMGVRVFNNLVSKGVKESDAKKWARAIAGEFGALKKEKKDNPLHDLEIEQLTHFSPEEIEAIDSLAEILSQSKQEPSEEQLKLLRKNHSAVDIALFGRMLASKPGFNVEAAVQVSHAITVHSAVADDDYFSAVDDLNNGLEDRGAAHIGEASFGSGVFYLYLCINRDLLDENLGKNVELRNKALSALLEAVTKVAPTGKQNSFASRAYASYVLVEKGGQQPRSLSLAFLKPVSSDDQMSEAIHRIEEKRQAMDKMYGPCADAHKSMHENGDVCLKDLISFVTNDGE